MSFDIPIALQMRMAVNFMNFVTRQQRLRTDEKVIADTIYGKVKGVKWRSMYGLTYYSFEGIPFAKPPLRELRFKAPVEPEPWHGVKRCMQTKTKPCQYNTVLRMVQGHEDCLYLNIYTRELNPTEPLPVLVWIYGGGFQMGEASRLAYSPDYLMMENIVLININYRVGAFGFLSLNDPACEVPGNAGLKDQIMALKWVKRNCHFFGGDPNNITVFGESAGAASTQFLMLTEQTRDLFHKAIVISGNMFAPWALNSDNQWAYKLAIATGYQGINDDINVLQHLRAVKPRTMIRAGDNLLTLKDRHERKTIFAFVPCVEPYIMDDCVMPKPPLQMLPDAWGNDIPLLIGGNSSEGLFMFTEVRKYPKLLTKLGNCEYLPPHDANLSEQQRQEFGQLIKSVYFGNEEPSLQTILQYCDIFTYKYFWHGIHRTLKARQKYAPNSPTYLYRFDYDSKHYNLMRDIACGRNVRGTCHADEIPFLFYNGGSKKLKRHTTEFTLMRRLVAIMVNFAKYANPNIPLNDNLKSFDSSSLSAKDNERADNVQQQQQQEDQQSNSQSQQWPPISAIDETFKCLNISDELEVIDLPESEKLKLWDNMYPDKSLLY